MCFFFRRDRHDAGSALENAFIMDMLIGEDACGDDPDNDGSEEDESDDELDELDEEFDEPVAHEISEKRTGGETRSRGRGCEITLSDLIFWETIFDDD